MSLINSFKVFREVYLLTGDYPHEKLYLLSASDGRKRVVLGSANLSYQAFSGIQRENICYIDGEEIFDINGTSLGHEKLNIAIAEVRDTAANFCNADVKAGYFNKIRTGDKAEQITEEEAQLIIDSNNFIRNRFSEFLN